MKILYLYRSRRREGPDTPSEFGYGAVQLAARGHSVDSLDSDEIARIAGVGGPGEPVARAPWQIFAQVAPWILPGIPPATVSHFATSGMRARLAGYDAVVATTTGLSLAAAFARRRGGFAGRLACLAMGILADSRPVQERFVCRWLLRTTTLVALSRAEADFLRTRIAGHGDIHDIPFGVDVGFWTPGAATAGSKPYVLAIGNDRQRDWATLVAAWAPDFPRLKIVTRLPLPALPPNVEAIRGGWHSAELSDAQVRDLYRGAELVVLPIRRTIQPSGQSACLQAMACGKAVVLSDIDGLWERAQMRDNHACWLVPPGDPDALRARVRAALDDAPARTALGSRARVIAEAHFPDGRMGDALGAILERRGAV